MNEGDVASWLSNVLRGVAISFIVGVIWRAVYLVSNKRPSQATLPRGPFTYADTSRRGITVPEAVEFAKRYEFIVTVAYPHNTFGVAWIILGLRNYAVARDTVTAQWDGVEYVVNPVQLCLSMSRVASIAEQCEYNEQLSRR